MLYDMPFVRWWPFWISFPYFDSCHLGLHALIWMSTILDFHDVIDGIKGSILLPLIHL